MRKRDKHLLEGAALSVVSMLVVSLFLVTSLGGVLIRGGQSAAVINAVLVDLTNQNRQQNNLASLTVNPTLVAAAQAKANDEAIKGYFAHVSPQGIDSWYWFKQAGYNFTYAGENLAVDFSDSADVVTAWMNSPTHRANILDGHYTEIGIATAQGMYEGHPTIFVVQEFGSPAETATAPISEQVLPSEPTQIAVASTRPSVNKPEVLGTTAVKPVIKPAVVATTAPEPVVASITTHANTEAVPAHAPVVADASIHQASVWDFYLASPKTTLRYAYYLIGFLILCTLFMITRLEFRQHHRRVAMLALGLLFMMGGLFFIADNVVFGTATIANSANSSTSSPSS